MAKLIRGKSYEFPAEINSSPIIDETGTIFISTRDGKIWAIGD